MSPRLVARIAIFIIGIAGFVALGLTLARPAYLADNWKGYELTPEQRKAIEDARLPNGATNCCGLADGIPIEWDLKNGHYLANFDQGWHPVPDDKILHNQKIPFAVIWLTPGKHMEAGKLTDYRDIRCFWPGPDA